MYSPKIKEVHIPRLYRLAKSKKQRMTQIVDDAIAQYLEKEVNNGWIDIVPVKK
jgi:predicted transcriptional regulator